MLYRLNRVSRAINEKLFKVQALLVIFIMLIFCNCVSCKQILNDKLWYKYAVEYIKADEIIIQHAIEKKETFLEDYNLRYKAETQLLNSSPPTLFELEQLLNSQNIIDKKVALVNIVKRHYYSYELFETILIQYDPNNDYFLKFYSYQCFNFLDKDKIKQFEDEVIRITTLENNEAIIISAMPTLAMIDSPKVVSLFVRFFKNGSLGLKRASYIYLKKMDEKYFKEVKKILVKENAIEALNFIKNSS